MPLVNPFGDNTQPTDPTANLPIGGVGVRPLGVPLGGAPDHPGTTPAPANDFGIQKFANLSAMTGGGAYNVGATPAQIIKDARNLQDSFASRAKIRGGFTSGAVGIDHIIPVSLGGRDDLENIQLLPKVEFDKKTVVDNLAYWLQQKGKISVAQARNLDKNWNNNPRALLDVEGLKQDPELAKDIVFPDGTRFNIHQALDKLPGDVGKTTFKDVVKEVVHEGPRIAGNAFFGFFKKAADYANEFIGAPLYGLARGIQKGNGLQTVIDETKNYYNDAKSGALEKRTGIQNPFDPNKNILLEVPKGTLTALSFGLMRPDMGTYDTPTKQTVAKGLNILGQAIGAAESFAGLKNLGAQYLPKVPGVAPAFEAISNTSLGKAIGASPYVKNLLTTTGIFGVQGQLTLPFASDLETRAEQLKHDVINSFIFSTAGSVINAKLPAVKGGEFKYGNMAAGTLANAYAGYVTSRMDGASQTDAALNGAVFGLLHGYGLKESSFALKAEQQAQKSAIDKFRTLGIDGRIETTKDINNAVGKARSVLAEEVASGNMTHAEAGPLYQDVIASAKFLNRQNLPVRTRVKQDLVDMASVFMESRAEKSAARAAAKAAALPPEQNKYAIDPEAQQYVDKLAKTPAPVVNENAIPSPAPVESVANTGLKKLTELNPLVHERFMTTGMANDKSPLANKGQAEVIAALAKNEPVTLTIIRRPNHPNDPNAVQVVGRIGDGATKILGYIPRKENIINNQNAKWADKPDMHFNPEANNTTFAQQMDQLGVKSVRARVNVASYGQLSNQPYMILDVPKEYWTEAQASAPKLGAPVRPVVEYNNRQELFDKIPQSIPKTLTNREFGQLESYVQNKNTDGLTKHLNNYGPVVDVAMQKLIGDKINELSYFDVYKLLSSAEANRTLNGQGTAVLNAMRTGLNEFTNIHGKDTLKQLLASPIAMGAPEGVQLPKPEEVPLPAPVTTPVPEFKAVGKVPGTRQDIFLNKATQQGKQQVMPDDYHAFGDTQQLTGISKRINNKVLELLDSGTARNDEKIQELYKFSRAITRDAIRNSAKRTATPEEFISNYVKKAEQLGIEPFDTTKNPERSKGELYGKYDANQLQEFKRLYWTSKQALPAEKMLSIERSPDGQLVMKETEGRSYEPASYLIEQFNKNGLEIRNIDSNASSNYTKKGQKAGDIVREIAETFDKQGYLFLGNQNGVPENSIAIKYNTPEFEKIVAKVNKNPEKYIPDDPKILEAYKQLNGGGQFTDKDKFLFGIYKDVLHLDKNVSAAEFYKRINLLNDRSIKYDQPGQYRVYVFPGTKLREVFENSFPSYIKDAPEFKELLDKVSQDGARFMFAQDIDQIRFDLGYPGKSYNLKGTTVGRLPDGSVFAEKGNTATLNDMFRNMFEKELGIKLQPGRDIVSFGENIKIGKSGLIPFDKNPAISYADVNKSDMRFIFKNPKEDPEGTFSMGILGKFSKDDHITNELVNVFGPAAEKWVDTIKRVVIKGEPITDVMKENYGQVLEESGFGKLKAMFRNKADRISLENQFNQNMIKLFQDTVMKNRDLRSAYVTVVPDMGYQKNGKTQLLRHDEIMLSKEMIKKLGLEPSADGNTYVLTARYPITKKLALSKQRVVVAEDHGINTLGTDNIIPNLFDTYVRKEGDFDGDAFMVYALIDKNRQNKLLGAGKALDGIPEEIANKIELDRAALGSEVGTTGIENTKYPKYPATVEGLLQVAVPASSAKQQLGGITHYSNIGKLLVDNQKKFYVGGKEFTPNMSRMTEDQIGQLIQEAVDATKSPALSQRDPAKQNPLSYIFGTTDPNELRTLSAELYSSYMAGLQANKKKYDALGGFTDYFGKYKPGLADDINNFARTAPEDANLWHPLQALFKKMENIPTFQIDNKAKWTSDRIAREEFAKTVPEPPMTATAKEFIDFVNNRRQQAQQINDLARTGQMDRTEASDRMAQLKQDVNDKYDAEFHNFVKNDLEAISWHLVADKGTNWYFDPRYESRNDQMGWFVERFDDLFQGEHAQAYYRARDKWFEENISKPLIDKFPGLQDAASAWVPDQQPNLAQFQNLGK